MTAKQPSHPQESASLSFEEITAEIGDISMPVGGTLPAEALAQEADGGNFPGGTVVVDDAAEVELRLNNLNTRVLTGGSPQPRPMWAEGLFCDVFAAALLLPVLLRAGLLHYQPWISYVAILLGLGGAIWSFLGVRVSESIPGRRMSWIAGLLGLILALLAFLFRVPPGY